MKRGEIWRVRLPGGAGHVQAGERPAIIVQDDQFTARLPTVLVVPFTSRGVNRNYPGTLQVNPDAQNGLATPSLALVFQLRVVDKRDCTTRLGILETQTFDQVLDILDKLTGR